MSTNHPGPDHSQRGGHSDHGKSQEALQKLLTIMSSLRDPQYGCAWDRKQTLRSLTSHTLEEVYEMIDAVESDDLYQLQDELGDLLFQIVFYAQIARENGSFGFADVIDSINAKLLRRHPHIFPDGNLASFGPGNPNAAISSDQVEVNWELIKEQERQLKAAHGGGNEALPASVLDDVPQAFPALDRAKKLQKRAASTGFDWKDSASVLAKLDEEIAELKEAVSSGGREEISHELGDVLFSCVNLARHLRVEPESVLREANQRFERRFRYVENAARELQVSGKPADIDVLEELWQRAKLAGL